MLNFKITTNLPYGAGFATVEKTELVASKEGKPRYEMWLQEVSTNEMIFLSCPLTDGFHIHVVNDFLTDILQNHPDSMPITPSGKPFTHVHFSSYAQYGKILSIVGDFLKSSEVVLEIEYREDTKHRPGHNEIIINNVFTKYMIQLHPELIATD